MKTRQITVCNTCRTKKLGCDGKRPGCTQCVGRGLECPGYRTDWVFRPQTSSDLRSTISKSRATEVCVRRQPKRYPENAKQPAASHLPPVRSISWPLGDVVSLCFQTFVPASSDAEPPQSRVCGGWIEVLPELIGSGDNEPLASTIRALGISMMATGSNGWAPVCDALKSRSEALRALRVAIHHESIPPEEILAAIMCLFVSEMLLPPSKVNSMVHAKALAHIFQQSRPESYASGAAHRLFLGFRPFLVLHGFLTRTSILFATKEWQNYPPYHTDVPAIQSLMTEACTIPSILERLDVSTLSTQVTAYSVARDSVFQLADVLNRLHLWNLSFRASAKSELTWLVTKVDGDVCVWYSSITAAECLTHLWAFWIICVINIRQLRAQHPGLQRDLIEIDGQRPESAYVSERILRLSIRILQSIEFLTRGEMKLSGKFGASIPLCTAWAALNDAEFKDLDYLSGTYQKVIQRITQGGFQEIMMHKDYPKAI